MESDPFSNLKIWDMQLQVLPGNKSKYTYKTPLSEQNFNVPPSLLEPEDAVKEEARRHQCHT